MKDNHREDKELDTKILIYTFSKTGSLRKDNEDL